MAVFEDLEQMRLRLMEAEDQLRARRIDIYSIGASAKLKQAEYALQMLRELEHETDAVSSTEEPAFTPIERIHFYVDSYFAFLYSVLDVISQVTNQKLRLNINEQAVSFKSVKRALDGMRPIPPVQTVYDTISRSRRFRNLEKYRNCSTHRRQIYLIHESISIEETAGYNTTLPITRVRRLICDDPIVLKPSIKQQRELIGYVSDMLAWAHGEISRIARSL